MAYTSYNALPGQLTMPSGPVTTAPPQPAHIPLVVGPFIVMPVKPIFVVNGNGVTLVTGDGAAGSRPSHGQQWSRGSHVVLSQYASSYVGVGQR